MHIQRKESHLPPPRLPPACLAEEALADPYFTGLSQPSREPSAQPISKLAFEFERRKLVVEEVRRAVHAVLRCLLLCMRCSLIAAFLDLAPDPASCLPACPCLPAVLPAVLQVRDLIYRELLEYHPQMLADYLAGGHQQVRG